MPEFFNSSLGLKLSVRQVVEEIIRYMQCDPKRKYKVMIGTDSEWLASKSADFVTAVVVHRVGNGGRYFWRRAEIGKFHTLRDRIIKEVIISLDLGKLVLEQLKNHSETLGDAMPEWDFEIHADVGERGPTLHAVRHRALNEGLREVEAGATRARRKRPRRKPPEGWRRLSVGAPPEASPVSARDGAVLSRHTEPGMRRRLHEAHAPGNKRAAFDLPAPRPKCVLDSPEGLSIYRGHDFRRRADQILR